MVATGARYRRLDIAELAQFEANSVYYAATQVEAQLCGGDPVTVVGGGNSAGQASLFLAKHAARVTIVVRGSELGEDMSRYLADRIENTPTIDVLLSSEVESVTGEGGVLETVVVRDNRSGLRRSVESRALFVFIGAEPHVDWLAGQVDLDEQGFVRTGVDLDLALGGPDAGYPSRGLARDQPTGCLCRRRRPPRIHQTGCRRRRGRLDGHPPDPPVPGPSHGGLRARATRGSARPRDRGVLALAPSATLDQLDW